LSEPREVDVPAVPAGPLLEALRTLPAHPLADAVHGTAGRTRAFLGHDARALHVLFEVDAEPPLASNARQRNDPVYLDECVEVFLCEPGPAGRYLEVVVNPAGIVYAARVVNPDGDRATWQITRGVDVPGLEVTASGDAGSASWWAVISIPWAAAGGTPARGETRRGNLYRIGRGLTTRHEALSPTRRDPADFHVPAAFAKLRIG